jgi:tryptophan 2,3-dioxygenase
LKDPVWVFCNNHRNRDRKRGLESHLTLAFARDLFEKQCEYCGQNPSKGIDRKDSSKGHTRENSVPCCFRCNHVKSDMPESAWDLLKGGMRLARESGSFGEWRIRRLKPEERKNKRTI